MERDAAFTQKKAERACLRVHLREKYRLPKVRHSTQETSSHFLRNKKWKVFDYQQRVTLMGIYICITCIYTHIDVHIYNT